MVETTDIVICGCGPTGALLSAYLSRMSIRHIIVEKEEDITHDPRGIALDEDGIRLLQGVGLYDKIYTEIGTCMKEFRFIGGTEQRLEKTPFMVMDYGTTEGGTGHVGFICHKQPALEANLRKTVTSATDFCDLRTGCTVTGISQDEHWTYCQYTDDMGDTHVIKSRFYVGADGKTGFTRKNYMEPLGINMEAIDRTFYDETWAALNWEISLPTKSTHPEFALWEKDYTPEQVYDLFFPENFRFLCNPDRPAVCGRFGLPSDRLWRFEFVVRSGEDPEEMCKQPMIEEVVFPYITHPGHRYGLPQTIQFPKDCIRVLRSKPFRFSARSCNRWSEGRVCLVGDAAHVFPPFGGQGIASGFRDAASLAWRLALLCRKRDSKVSDSHCEVLEAWYNERKQQLEQSLASTIQNGAFVNEQNPIKIFIRLCWIYIQCLVPSLRRNIRLGRRADGPVQYTHQEGMPFLTQYRGGLCLPQVYCKRVRQVSKSSEHSEVKGAESPANVFFSDDVIFSNRSNNSDRLFRLLVYLPSIDQLQAAQETVSDIESLSKGEISSSEVTFLLEEASDATDKQAGYIADKKLEVYRLATASEFAASRLCQSRPEPRFYDPYCLGKSIDKSRYVILRPDRFVFAVVNTREDLVNGASTVADYCQSI